MQREPRACARFTGCDTGQVERYQIYYLTMKKGRMVIVDLRCIHCDIVEKTLNTLKLVYDRYKYLPIKSAETPADISVNQDISAYRCCVISVSYQYLYRQIRKKCHIGRTLTEAKLLNASLFPSDMMGSGLVRVRFCDSILSLRKLKLRNIG